MEGRFEFAVAAGIIWRNYARVGRGRPEGQANRTTGRNDQRQSTSTLRAGSQRHQDDYWHGFVLVPYQSVPNSYHGLFRRTTLGVKDVLLRGRPGAMPNACFARHTEQNARRRRLCIGCASRRRSTEERARMRNFKTLSGTTPGVESDCRANTSHNVNARVFGFSFATPSRPRC